MIQVFNTMMTALPVLIEATRRGIRVDPVYAEKWRGELRQQLRDLHAQWPYADVDPASSRQVANLLYTRMGLPPAFTDKGGYSADANALRACMAGAPPEHLTTLQLLLDMRESQTSLSTFAGLTVSRVHPQFLPQDKDEDEEKAGDKGQGAGTGRIQPRRPNTAQQPDAARFLFLPDPGMVLAYLDWHAAEGRVEACLSHDAALLEALLGDLHSVLERELGIDRTRAKNVYYGTGRGAGPRKLVKTLRGKGYYTTEPEMAAAQAKLNNAFPAWAKWRAAEHMAARASRRIQNPFGRRWDIHHPSLARKAVARIVQSSVADMLWRVLAGWPKAAQLLTPVHDAVLVQIPHPDVALELQAVMEQAFDEIGPGFKVPVKVAVGAPGASWGDLH
jgi:DNA polymerase I-like protein with 3'-5' exonuclease and polymerase domains